MNTNATNELIQYAINEDLGDGGYIAKLAAYAADEQTEKDAKIAALEAENARLRTELQTTAKHKLLDGSFCWCDKAMYELSPEYGHTAICCAHRDALGS